MSALGARLRELQVAVMLLTRLPAGRIAGEAPSLGAARWAFPLVGLAVGAIGWAAFAGALGAGAAPPLAAVLALAAQVLATGALHVDGLADFADGIGGGRDRAHCLEIMRDSRIGSYGVMALILVSGLWVAALAQIGAQGGGSLGWFLVIGLFSRGAMVAVQEVLPPAREDGMGRLAAGRSRRARTALLALVLISVLLTGWTGVALALVCGATGAGLGGLARRRIGGLTGDVLGAVQLLSETLCWAMLAVLLG